MFYKDFIFFEVRIDFRPQKSQAMRLSYLFWLLYNPDIITEKNHQTVMNHVGAFFLFIFFLSFSYFAACFALLFRFTSLEIHSDCVYENMSRVRCVWWSYKWCFLFVCLFLIENSTYTVGGTTKSCKGFFGFLKIHVRCDHRFLLHTLISQYFSNF